MKPPLKRSRSAPDGGDEETQEQLQDQIAESNSIEEEEKTDNATLLRLLEEGEKVLCVLLRSECAKAAAKDKEQESAGAGRLRVLAALHSTVQTHQKWSAWLTSASLFCPPIRPHSLQAWSVCRQAILLSPP